LDDGFAAELADHHALPPPATLCGGLPASLSALLRVRLHKEKQRHACDCS
jgi:hypothetical protein